MRSRRAVGRREEAAEPRLHTQTVAHRFGRASICVDRNITALTRIRERCRWISMGDMGGAGLGSSSSPWLFVGRLLTVGAQWDRQALMNTVIVYSPRPTTSLSIPHALAGLFRPHTRAYGTAAWVQEGWTWRVNSSPLEAAFDEERCETRLHDSGLNETVSVLHSITYRPGFRRQIGF